MADFLKKVELFRDLDKEKLKYIAQSSQIKNYAKGDILLRAGQSAYFLYIIIRGRAQEQVIDKNGFNISLHTEGAYGYFGEMGILLKEGYCSTVTAITELEALCVPAKLFLRLAKEDNRIFLAVIRILKRRLENAVQKEVSYTQMNAETRIAYAITGFYRGERKKHTLDTTQDLLADACGIARQTVSKILNKWKNLGIVRLKRGSIEILDEGKLSDMFL